MLQNKWKLVVLVPVYGTMLACVCAVIFGWGAP